jgi:hypothetical protein
MSPILMNSSQYLNNIVRFQAKAFYLTYHFALIISHFAFKWSDVCAFALNEKCEMRIEEM